VPLFVKRPGQHRGRRSRAFARTTDILPTIADVLNLRVPWRTAGRSAFSRAIRRRHTVRLMGRAFHEPVVKLSTRRFARRWRRRIRAQHALF
jgi:arylsulfatase A-like enzyme